MKKKNLKIILSLFLTIILIGVSITRIVFSKHSFMGGIQKVTFFSQSPSYRDKGFNELTYNGANDYATATKTMVGNTSTASYSDDGSSYVHEIANIYDLGAETIISSAFNVASSFSGTEDYAGLYEKGYENKTVVILDDDSLSSINPNAISINFKSQDAGFIAGIAASIYTTYAIEEGYDVKPTMALWGGLAFPTVYDWLSGFEQSVNWFNYQILGFKLDGTRMGKEDKVESWEDLKNNHNKSLELAASSKPVQEEKDNFNKFKKLNQPIKINNAGDVTVDYTKTPPVGSNDGVNFDPITSFYTGGFGFDPNDQASGSNAAVKIKKIKSKDGKDSIVFPVAGGQTMETLANLSAGSKTMAVGVDSDAEAASPNYGGNILGSATKNIELAANFATWYSQNRDATPEVQEKYEYKLKDGNTMNAKEFINEWTSKDNENIIGTQFTGNFQNHGVGFDDNGSNKVGKYLNYFLTDENWTTEDFLTTIVPDIFDMNNNTIEASSETFLVQDGEPAKHSHATLGMSKDYPWIPDWINIYYN